MASFSPPRRALVAGAVLAVTLLAGVCNQARTPSAPSGTGHPARRAASPEFPVTLRDDDGVAVTMTEPPKRIITFAPSNTEIVFALGLGDRVVGVSGKFDDHPAQAKDIAEVGGAGQFGVDPNVERVVSLRPDLMLAISGGDEWKKRLRDLGIAVFTINATDLDDLLHDIATVGKLTGATLAAKQLTSNMAATAATIEQDSSAEPAVSCFFEAYFPPLTSVGPHTFIFDLLQRAGCDPVTSTAKSDYPEWSVDQLVQESPAVYLVASESGVSPREVAKRPGFGAIAAVRDGRVFLVDSDLISRPGPRVILGLQALASVLHPATVP
jgi:cobalamin transport system substrate-binding protein